MKILQLDHNHPLIAEQLSAHGFTVEDDHISSYEEVLNKIHLYDGIILRSRIPVDANLLRAATNLKFIGRVGAGMENIDVTMAQASGIRLFHAPEGNRDALAEHVLGMLLLLMHRLKICSEEVKNGIWLREENRGDEIMGKTVGLIGYGNMGKAVAKRFRGFGCEVIFHDILPNLTDEYAVQVSLKELQHRADIISLHIPLTPQTCYLIDQKFIRKVTKPFYLVNSSRGKNVKTSDLVSAIKAGTIKGAALDVLEFETSSFEKIDRSNSDLAYLLNSESVLITPHIAGWTHQSKEKLAQVIVDKILAAYC